jgi:nucleotide-binding universal stress UspA family protein
LPTEVFAALQYLSEFVYPKDGLNINLGVKRDLTQNRPGFRIRILLYNIFIRNEERNLYKTILVPLDNSEHSNMGIDVAAKLAAGFGAKLVGNHVYAARLHDKRFRQMESGLPERYLEEKELGKQREVHDDLITKGLQIITDSYLDIFEKKCLEEKVQFEKSSREGKNFTEIVKDVEEKNADLVVMGALGVGAIPGSTIGSVCERVARRVRKDLFVVKNTSPMNGGGITVAVDGSPQSFGGILTGIKFARLFSKKLTVISVFDPFFHYVAFNNIAKVLSEESSKIFKFQEQEKLHEEIIDSGLARIYQGHLDVSRIIAKKEGTEIETKLLSGKAFEKVLNFVEEEKPWLLIMGRIGVHSDPDMDIGSNTENVLRSARCHVLISSREFVPAIEETGEVNMAWTKEAEKRMEKIPPFAKGMARMGILRFAKEKGHSVITSDVIDQAIGSLLPAKAREAMGITPQESSGNRALHWTPEALEELEKIQEGFKRDHTRLRLEKHARTLKLDAITREILVSFLKDGIEKE